MTLFQHKGAAGKMTGAPSRALRLPRAAIAGAALLFAGSVGVFVVIAEKPATGESASELGVAYMGDGDYRRAAETLRAAYRIHPSEETKVALARALLGSGDYAGVLDLLKSGEPEADARYGHLRAEALMRAERYDDARAVASEILAANPADGRSMLVSARALYGLGDADAAAEFLSKALRARDGVLGDAWLFRARMALDANDLGAAAGALARAREAAAPERILALFDSEVLLRAGDFAAARAALPVPLRRKNSRKAPVIDAQREYALARIDAAAGDYLSAARRIRAIKPALAGEPNGALVAGLIHEGSRDIAQAESQYRSALTLAPNDAALLDALAAMLTKTKRYDEALAVAERLQTAAPSLGALRRMTIFAALGDEDRVLAAARRIDRAGIAPTAAAVAFGVNSKAAKEDAARLAKSITLAGAATALQQGGAKAAETADVLTAFSTDPVALALAGDLYFAAGDDAAAAADFDRALALAPHFEAALEGRLRAHIREGDLGDAETWLFSVIATDADNRAARVALARLLRKDGREFEAAAALSPVANRLFERPRDALLYGDLLASIGAAAEVEDFARKARHNSATAPLAAEILARAGRLDSAGLAARDALLDSPEDESRGEDFASLMIELGRTSEATVFANGLLARRPGAMGAQRALARLASGEIPRASIRDAGSAPTAEIARKAYLGDPTDPLAASRFGRALLASGAEDAGARVLREACFFSLEGYCRDGAPRS